MCGGIGFNPNLISEEELLRFFTQEEVDYFFKTGEAQIFFWSIRPVLPAETAGAVHLFDWGNRDKNIDLPKTGWARIESLEAGRWNYLNPVEVIIPASRGYEKKIWFNTPDKLKGVIVEKDGNQRIYMITKPADQDYINLTGHDRMPVFKNQ